MSRVSRKSMETSFFHIMAQGVNREKIFYKSKYIKKYLSLIDKYKKEYNISVIAYCVMNNHIHMLIHTENVNCMSKFMHRINGIYGQYYNKYEDRVGIVFRNRYVSEPIYDQKYLASCINYIHMNPVKAKIVKKCDEYEYSSFKFFNNNENTILIEIFGKNYIELINNSDNNSIFYDIDLKREEYLDLAVKEFEKVYNDNLDNILKDRMGMKKLISYLRTNYKIKYVDMMKKFRTNQG